MHQFLGHANLGAFIVLSYSWPYSVVPSVCDLSVILSVQWDYSISQSLICTSDYYPIREHVLCEFVSIKVQSPIVNISWGWEGFLNTKFVVMQPSFILSRLELVASPVLCWSQTQDEILGCSRYFMCLKCKTCSWSCVWVHKSKLYEGKVILIRMLPSVLDLISCRIWPGPLHQTQKSPDENVHILLKQTSCYLLRTIDIKKHGTQ